MIEVQEISKAFGKKKILENISFTILENNVCCLLGKNGVGKSTLINIITQMAKQDYGKIIINNKIFDPYSVLDKEKIGLVSEANDLINELTGFQFLTFRSLIFHIPKSIFLERAHSLIAYLFETTDDLYRQIYSYSTGMKMKLKIIAALVSDPSILILDEPFANLDPIASQRLATLIEQYARKNSNIVLISSHDLLYVDKIATQICVLDDTSLIFNGTKDEFTKNSSGKIDQSLLKLIEAKEISIENLNWLI